MKNYVVLAAGTVSMIAAIVKLVFAAPYDWVWVVAPLWVPLALAYLIFVGLFVHALGTGKLAIVPKPAPGDTGSEKPAPVLPLERAPAETQA